MNKITVLTEESLPIAVRRLGRRDRDLKAVVKQYGCPPLWKRQEGFATLVQIILEQQVSLESGRATYERLRKAAGLLTPKNVLALSDSVMRECAVSRQKARYVRILAEAVKSRELNLKTLPSLSDEGVAEELMKLIGIGQWTADVYRLMAMGRADIWPCGDVALAKAMQELKQLRERPDLEKQLAIAEAWRPYRAAAARVLWHHYLSVRGRS